MLDMGAPSRWLLPFARAGAIGMLRVYLDGAIEISGALDFPAPTAALSEAAQDELAELRAQVQGDIGRYREI